MVDVLERAGYYDALVEHFDGLHAKRDGFDRELEEGLMEKMQIASDLDALLAELKDLESRMIETRREGVEIDELLAELTAGGLRAARALQRMKLPSDAERAAELREDFRLRAGVSLEASDATIRPASDGSVSQSVQEQDLTFTSADGAEVALRCYVDGVNSAVLSSLPVLVYFHGGGHVTGDFDTHNWICRSLAAQARFTVVAVDYRRAPEWKFPTAFDDAYAAVCWIAAGGLGYSPWCLGVAGDSNGASLAMSCCLRARDAANGPDIQLQVLFYPWADLRPDSDVMQQLELDEGNLPYLVDMDWNRSVYAPRDDASSWSQDDRASPLVASTLANLPAAFIAYAEDDPLAPESAALAERLRAECGHEAVHTMALEGPLGHGFVSLATERPQTFAAVAAASAFASAAVRAPLSPLRSPPGSPKQMFRPGRSEETLPVPLGLEMGAHVDLACATPPEAHDPGESGGSTG